MRLARHAILMKKTPLLDAEDSIFILQDEIRRTHEVRYDHRLHAMLLVTQGLSSHKVSLLLGDSQRTLAYWIRQFNEEGLAGLAEAERPGRPQ